MKVVILAGGEGLRLREYTEKIPKALVKIGSKPIIWHIIKYFSIYGYNEFIMATGYKGEFIENYFQSNSIENCNINIVDTGIETQTGGRLKRAKEYIGNETFILTWCDQLYNINVKELVNFHKKSNKLATIVATKTASRFGRLILKDSQVKRFIDKSQILDEWIDGGVYVLEPKILDFICDDSSIFEKEVLVKLSENNQLAAYKHTGFWQCMDTYKEWQILKNLWQKGNTPWKIWK